MIEPHSFPMSFAMKKHIALALGGWVVIGFSVPGASQERGLVFAAGSERFVAAPGDKMSAHVRRDDRSKSWVVDLKLPTATARKVGWLTSRNVGETLVVSNRCKVIAEARVNEPILGGSLTIAGSFKQAQAEAIAADIERTGREEDC